MFVFFGLLRIYGKKVDNLLLRTATGAKDAVSAVDVNCPCEASNFSDNPQSEAQTADNSNVAQLADTNNRFVISVASVSAGLPPHQAAQLVGSLSY